jgi:hypothetical protein
MENHRSDTVTLLITLYEAGLALYAMYYVAVSINLLFPEPLLSNPISLNLFFP